VDSLTVESLGKRYLIPVKSALNEPPKTLNLGLTRLRLPRLRLPGGAVESRDLWALRHLSFSVPRGTILGILGANGAGKSTLLKIIARVTRPTEGRVIGSGRVVSLLELGAGFNARHPAARSARADGPDHSVRRAR
jgi:lipopolysaccharide transport system ATP-binding protein